MELDIIYNEDCLGGMKRLPDKSIDLVVTDPPYNVGIDYGNQVNDKRENFIEWMKPRFQEMRRVAHTVLITGQARLPDYALIEPWKWLLAWFKPAAMGRSPVGFCNFEPIAMWGQGHSQKVDVIRATIKPDKTLCGHPCPKPLDWALGQLKIFPKAQIILDPFLGSGTTAIACKRLDRHYIGFEISKEYCQVAKQRLEAEKTLWD